MLWSTACSKTNGAMLLCRRGGFSATLVVGVSGTYGHLTVVWSLRLSIVYGASLVLSRQNLQDREKCEFHVSRGYSVSPFFFRVMLLDGTVLGADSCFDM